MSKLEREQLFAPYTEQNNILERFNFVRKSIEEQTGLTLSNIELVGLKRITEEVMRQMVKDAIGGINRSYTTDPHEEIPARFFQEFYDIDISTLKNIPGDKSDNLNFDEATRKYLQQKQEESHLI